MSVSDVEVHGEDEILGYKMSRNRKLQFMKLIFEERLLKMKAYFVYKEFPFYNISREEKRNSRNLSKQFMINVDGQMLKKKVQLRRKEVKGNHMNNYFNEM